MINKMSVEQIAGKMNEMSPVDQVLALEVMHRRILQIGDERIAQLPTPDDAPEPGILGGRNASLRRTVVRESLFYLTDTSGTPMEEAAAIPIFPNDEYNLLHRINRIGFSILESMSADE